jgi:hypothetical protein
MLKPSKGSVAGLTEVERASCYNNNNIGYPLYSYSLYLLRKIRNDMSADRFPPAMLRLTQPSFLRPPQPSPSPSPPPPPSYGQPKPAVNFFNTVSFNIFVLLCFALWRG